MPQTLRSHLLNVSVIVNYSIFNLNLYYPELQNPFDMPLEEDNKLYEYTDEDTNDDDEEELKFDGLLNLGGDLSGNHLNFIVVNSTDKSRIDKYIQVQDYYSSSKTFDSEIFRTKHVK